MVVWNVVSHWPTVQAFMVSPRPVTLMKRRAVKPQFTEILGHRRMVTGHSPVATLMSWTGVVSHRPTHRTMRPSEPILGSLKVVFLNRKTQKTLPSMTVVESRMHERNLVHRRRGTIPRRQVPTHSGHTTGQLWTKERREQTLCQNQ